jgi:chromosome partitioning protein
MGKIISIANQKGGVGKTTTAINLAASLAVIEHPTLIIDIDPQSNTTSGLGIEPKSVTNSVYEVMVGGVDINETIRETEMPFLRPCAITHQSCGRRN